MKKILLMLISILTALSLVSCGDGGANDGGKENNDGEHQNNTVTYTITVLDADTPVVGANVFFMKVSDGGKKFVTTDSFGKATFTADKGVMYMGGILSASGYTGIDTTPQTFPADKNLTINLSAAEDSDKETYTIYVKDSAGEPVAGIKVQMCIKGGQCKPVGTTDAEGKIVVLESDAEWQAQITGESEYHDFDSDNTVIIIVE